MKRNIIKKAFTLALCFTVMIGNILFTTVTSNAAHQSTCDTKHYFKYIYNKYPNYSHSSQYGQCQVNVTEVHQYFECQCGDESSSKRINRVESHSQPHG